MYLCVVDKSPPRQRPRVPVEQHMRIPQVRTIRSSASTSRGDSGTTRDFHPFGAYSSLPSRAHDAVTVARPRSDRSVH